MNQKPSMAILRSLLFVFSIENTYDEQREEFIVSKNINVEAELVELFDVLLKPRFFIFRSDGQQKLIDAISYYLYAGDSFDELFEYFDTYFDQEIEDQRHFMRVLLACLKRYQLEASLNS